MKLDTAISKIVALRDKKSALNSQISEINTQIDALSQELMAQCDALGTDQIRSTTHTATISVEQLPDPQDWDKIYKWIKRNPTEGFALLRRQLNSAPWRDLLHTRGGRDIPGIGRFIKRSLSVRKTRS